jgi:hypothetical protein
MQLNRIIQHNVLKTPWPLPDNSVDCCVTSPPYWGLRNYGVDGQLGLEKTPEEFIEKMVAVFQEVKRVLKPEGTCWINIGDSYANGRIGRDMWIIPSNHPLVISFCPGILGLERGLERARVKCRVAAYVEIEAFIIANLVAGMEAGVLDPAPIWTDAKTFDARPFVERYTASLEVIHVPENRLPGYEKAICIKDSFGRLLEERSRQADLFGAFLKTWTTTLRERIRLYNEAYEIWVMQLRQESLQRRKLALLRRERESSSLRWPTRRPVPKAAGPSHRGPPKQE